MSITALGFLFVFIVGALITIKKPFIGLLLYFFVFYMHPPGKYWGAYLPEIRWTLIVAVITLISTVIHEKELNRWLKPIETKLLLAFFTFVSLQLLWVDVPEWHIIYATLLFKLIILYFLMITLISSEKRLIAVIIVNAVGAAYIGFNAIQTHGGGRFEAAGLPSISDGNLLAIHLIPIIFLGATVILTSIKKKFFILLPLAFVGNLFFMAGSRGGIVGLILAGMVFVWFTPKGKRTLVYRWSFIAITLASIIVGPLLLERMKEVSDAENAESVDKSAFVRIVLAESQLEMLKDNLLTGYGHRGTLILSPVYLSEEYMTNTAAGKLRGSHNLTLSYLVDHGVLGGGLVFLMMFLTFKRIRLVNISYAEKPNVSLILLGSVSGLIGVLAASQFSNSKVLEISIWMVALIVSCSLILERENSY